MLLLAFDAMRGAVTRSNVKVTEGAVLPSPPRPRRTTVSPLRTDLILAVPRLGRMVTMIASVFVYSVLNLIRWILL